MDSGLSLRPNGLAQSGSVRLDAAPVRDAVPTSLSAGKSVTAASKSSETRAEDTSHVRKIVLDAHSREVICQVLEAGSGRIIRQTSEEATLRLRAYARALANRAKPNRARPRGDLDVEA
jgi:hypothetical protein